MLNAQTLVPGSSADFTYETNSLLKQLAFFGPSMSQGGGVYVDARASLQICWCKVIENGLGGSNLRLVYERYAINAEWCHMLRSEP